MKTRLWTAMIGSATLLGIAALAEDRPDRVEPQSMKQAIDFERQKQQAADRQAVVERQRERAQATADRSADRQTQKKKNKTPERGSPAANRR